jgi:S-(hydroxymethyl)glutathione dehydrogenase/alcohol dehydrogenase
VQGHDLTVVAGVRPGDTVVVVGLGSIGLNAVQAAVLAGAARVMAIVPCGATEVDSSMSEA